MSVEEVCWLGLYIAVLLFVLAVEKNKILYRRQIALIIIITINAPNPSDCLLGLGSVGF